MKIHPTLAVLGVVGVLALAGCGGGSSTTVGAGANGATTTAAAAQGQAGQGGPGGGRFNDPAVQECLASKGINLPQRGQGRGPGGQGTGQGQAGAGATPGQPQAPTSTIDPALRQALQDCGVTGGGFGGGAGRGLNDPAMQQCLAAKGVNLPQRGQAQPGQTTTPTSPDPAVRQAIQDCRSQAGPTTTATG